MDITSIIIAAAVVGVVGILAGILLGVASVKFKVEVNEKEIEVRNELPGINCGACGYPGCDGLAEAIAKGEAKPGSCLVGGEPVATKIAAIVGGNVSVEKKVAYVKCKGNCEKAKEAYEYVGPKDCMIASNTPGGGAKGCSYGCLGFGNCKNACPFGAISIVDSIAVIDKEKCKGCESCVAACPRHIIEMIPYEAKAVVGCNSHDAGKEVKMVCDAGCIGCGLCQKNCPNEAITVVDKLAKIDYNKCTGCGICKEKCPVKIIN